MNLCKHGCGKQGLYKRVKGGWCCSKISTHCEAIRKKNSLGVAKAHAEGRCVSFTDKHRTKRANNGKNLVLSDIFTKGRYRSNHYLKSLIQTYNLFVWECATCKNAGDWCGKKLILELDHIDGNAANCRIDNLRLLCPNCHSQTSTFRGRGTNTGKKKVSDEELVESIKKSKNIYDALIAAGLSPRGGNYARVAKLISKFSLHK